MEDELIDVLVAQCGVRSHQSGGPCAREDPVSVQSAPVVRHLDVDAAPLLVGGERHGARRGLVLHAPDLGRLDAVVDRVAHEVDQRVGDLLADALVDLGLLAGHEQRDRLAALPREITHDARKTVQDGAQGQHANAHDPFLAGVVSVVFHRRHGVAQQGQFVPGVKVPTS